MSDKLLVSKVAPVGMGYDRTLQLAFVDGVLCQFYVSGHTGGGGLWVAIPELKSEAVAEPVKPVVTSPALTAPVAPPVVVEPVVVSKPLVPTPVASPMG